MQFSQDGHSEIQHQLLITLLHGTWPHGFFRTFFWMRHRSPLWYHDGSPFLSRLSTELHDIPHKIKPLPWSGKNSIFVRDEAAHVLAEHLSAEQTEQPQPTQLVIALSHGGNIALRALHHLQKRGAAQLCEEERANPFIVTLATPFVEVHRADLIMAIGYFLTLVPGFILSKPYDPLSIPGLLIALLIFCCFILICRWGGRWISRGTARSGASQCTEGRHGIG
jgi:hypothetical protein